LENARGVSSQRATAASPRARAARELSETSAIREFAPAAGPGDPVDGPAPCGLPWPLTRIWCCWRSFSRAPTFSTSEVEKEHVRRRLAVRTRRRASPPPCRRRSRATGRATRRPRLAFPRRTLRVSGETRGACDCIASRTHVGERYPARLFARILGTSRSRRSSACCAVPPPRQSSTTPRFRSFGSTPISGYVREPGASRRPRSRSRSASGRTTSRYRICVCRRAAARREARSSPRRETRFLLSLTKAPARCYLTRTPSREPGVWKRWRRTTPSSRRRTATT